MNNNVHQRFLPLPLKHPVSHLVLADWELSLVIPRGMVPLLQSSTFLYRRKLVLLTRLYNCICSEVSDLLISFCRQGEPLAELCTTLVVCASLVPLFYLTPTA